ncbi:MULTISPECIES: MarR family winged helix-turn-helix transcriptional regulator [Oceanimonas]|uniref:MarR family transcriptional regulator n=1 Tax=Oceanimonas doudoroffii TaxID=84158 RepID=A0A233RJB3_9GAMM|nr:MULTISPECIES: MarR family transcriptional regulator [Oceanimonas]NHH99921.1 Multidrug resistance operon repressor [Oceanimonas sp. MB9]OXY83476.1 MarR family transcriptional regulator [Oceanimonas doudoroffii]
MDDHSDFELERFLPYKLMQVAERVSSELAAFYREEFGITRPEWRLLAVTGQGRALIARELAELTCMDKVKVSRALQGLEVKGLIRRSPSPRDQRAARIALTPAGRALYRRMVPRVLEWEHRLAQGLAEGETRPLVDTLNRLLTQLERMGDSRR